MAVRNYFYCTMKMKSFILFIIISGFLSIIICQQNSDISSNSRKILPRINCEFTSNLFIVVNRKPITRKAFKLVYLESFIQKFLTNNDSSTYCLEENNAIHKLNQFFENFLTSLKLYSFVPLKCALTRNVLNNAILCLNAKILALHCALSSSEFRRKYEGIKWTKKFPIALINGTL